MAHNTRVRGPGDWTDELPPTDTAALDLLQHQSLTKRGGAWAPSSPIEIGGAQGLEITGPGYFDQVISVNLATGVGFEYDSYVVEREHLMSPGVGVDFRVQQLFDPLDDGIYLQVGDVDVPLLVQGDADVDPDQAHRWWIPLSLPVGSVITKLAISLSAEYAHDGGEDDVLPATMPRLALIRADHDDPFPASGYPTFDPSPTLDEYRALHDIEQTHIVSPTYDGTQLWWAVIDGEYGEGAQPRLYVTSVRTTVTQTAHDEFQI